MGRVIRKKMLMTRRRLAEPRKIRSIRMAIRRRRSRRWRRKRRRKLVRRGRKEKLQILRSHLRQSLLKRKRERGIRRLRIRNRRKLARHENSHKTTDDQNLIKRLCIVHEWQLNHTKNTIIYQSR